MLASLFGWIVSTIFFLFKSFPGRGAFEATKAKLWGGLLLTFFGIWIAGLLNA